MDGTSRIVVDANEAVASVAHRSSELVVLYPITPASPMGEHCDEWSVAGRRNLWGSVPRVVEMQSEAGAAGAVHGALQGGSLVTTFTSSQGLLLMLPNLYKIAGELNAFCMHVAARTVATHALSIFGDHSDVMACRQSGFAMLASSSAQEAQDLAAIAHAATLQARVPFMHFFDGFRTSHEIADILPLPDDDLRYLYDDGAILAHRDRALDPDRPVLRGTAQNPDTFFQAREACNPFYDACPGIVQRVMEKFAWRTDRRYRIFDYFGHPKAERVIVAMGSGAQVAAEMAECMARRDEPVGVVIVRLYRPFSVAAFSEVLPSTVRSVAVLDRTKEPGALGEPLYLDVVAALNEAIFDGRIETMPRVLGGRYGLSSKEFTPAMAKAVFDALDSPRPKKHFTVGIRDDVTHRSLPLDQDLDIEAEDVTRAVFFGLGSDGTVGSNKNTVRILGQHTSLHVQGYFVYDSRKAGAVTISHLRFSPRPIRSHYLIRKASFVACHQPRFLDRYDMLELAAPGGTFLLNSPVPADSIWDTLPVELQRQIIDKQLRFYVVDAFRVAKEAGLGRRINTAMQTCFFALSGLLPADEATAAIKDSIRRTWGKRGPEIVRRNLQAVDTALAELHEVEVPAEPTATRSRPPIVAPEAPDFVQRVTATMLAGRGDLLPVSAFPTDGTWPVGTTRWEKRSIAREIPIWDPAICIQCNKCALMCPHAAIRAQLARPAELVDAPDSLRSAAVRGLKAFKDWRYLLQVAPDDCTGCGLCVAVCPAKDKSRPRHKAIDMEPVEPHREAERSAFAFFSGLPGPARTELGRNVKEGQFLQPLIEFSGACAGCGETPYIKLLTQMFGDRLVIANATGCSSIYGGNLPTTPYCADPQGRGPAWSNSLFEDNAEFGLGLRLAVDGRARVAADLLKELSGWLGDEIVRAIVEADQSDDAGIDAQRERVEQLRRKLQGMEGQKASWLRQLAFQLVRRSVWIVGGDGWAYDIGYGGLDHVLASNHDVNILVLDTEVYSNTGGQQSKATPLGAAAKFAAAGKEVPKKDLGLLAMAYGHVYVASVALGAKDAQAVNAIREAEAWHGPSLVLAYSHCIAHGYDLSRGAAQQKLAVEAGLWPLYRFDPRRIPAGEPPLHLDSRRVKARVADYMRNEGRFRMVELRDPARFKRLLQAAGIAAKRRHAVYEQLAGLRLPPRDAEAPNTEDES